MSALRARVRRTIERYELCPRGSRLVVALSGGSDSTALLHLLMDLAPAGEFTVAGAVHVHHQLRETADADAEFCRRLAVRLDVPIEVVRVDVRARALADRLSPEDAARVERYDALRRVAVHLGASRIATGHTRDDQVETLLMKLARGAGLTGAGGIYPHRDDLVRPLLEASRAELRAYLGTLGEAWVEDETNADRAVLRNRVRHELVPVVARVFGPAALTALADAALRAGEDGRWLDQVAAAERARLTVPASPPLVQALAAAPLRALPPPVAHRVLLLAMREARPDVQVRAEHVEGALAVAHGRQAAVDTPAGRWELSGPNVVLLTRDLVPGAAFAYDLPVPGAVEVPEAGGRVTAVAAAEPAGGAPSGMAVVVRALPGFVVRSRRPGDVIRLRAGRRKLQDLFVDAGVPRWEREARPVVTDADDRVVWVPGLGVSEDFRVDPAGGKVVTLRFSPEGEQA